MTDTARSQVDSIADFANTPDGALDRWKSELELAEKEFKPYWDRCDDIFARYRAETEQGETLDGQQMPTLWSQVATEIPAIYQRKPQPQVSRRFKARAPAARIASMVLERYLAVDIDRDRTLDSCFKAMVRSYLLTARSVAWLDIKPEEMNERIVDLRVPVKYLPPRDFMHSPSRCWEEVTWVARKHLFTRDKAVATFKTGMKRFGWNAEDLPLDCEPRYSSDKAKQAAGDVFKRATIWEVWDAQSGMIIFVHRGMTKVVDMRQQPVKLESRFPAPEPAYGTLTDESLIPVPDYVQWQALADEIDELSTRIMYLTEAAKVVGVHDAANPALSTILTTGKENELVAVDAWVAFKEKGGVQGAIEFVPIEQIVSALQMLGEQRLQRIELLNQMSGFSDVMRGQGDPRTTATQDRIKSNYGSLRLQEKQADFTRFVDRILRVKGEIIAELAPAEVLVMVSDALELPEVQQAREQQQQMLQQQMQQGMGPQQPPPDPLAEAVQLLKDDKLRDFRLEVQERSMAAIDESQEREEASEFTGAMADLVSKAASAPPEMMDFVGETALFVARRHRVGREMEATLETALGAIKNKAEAARAQPPQPPPQVQAEQMRHQNTIAEMKEKHQLELVRIDKEAERTERLETAQAQSQEWIAKMELQMKQQLVMYEARVDAWLKQQDMEFKERLEERKAQLEMMITEFEARHQVRLQDMQAETQRFTAAAEARDKERRKPRKLEIDGEVFTAKPIFDDDEPMVMQ